MTDRPKNDIDERLARLAARGRAARPAPTAPAVHPAQGVTVPPPPPSAPPRSAPAPRRAPVPAATRAKHPAEGSRLAAGLLSVATVLGIVGGLAFGAHQPASAQPAAATTRTVVVVPTSPFSSGTTTTRSVPAPAPLIIPTPTTSSGGS